MLQCRRPNDVGMDACYLLAMCHSLQFWDRPFFSVPLAFWRRQSFAFCPRVGCGRMPAGQSLLLRLVVIMCSVALAEPHIGEVIAALFRPSQHADQHVSTSDVRISPRQREPTSHLASCFLHSPSSPLLLHPPPFASSFDSSKPAQPRDPNPEQHQSEKPTT